MKIPWLGTRGFAREMINGDQVREMGQSVR